ncbi:MAG: hypothetical protein JNG89_07680 [Planctomycetaceae bacterium]|nr:hypothetical protein [Planctomycetaceae bacterium]
MDTFSRMSSGQRANLTAYLDGELDETETAEIETVLSRSSVARNDVEVLARTYDLLDQLPRYQVTTAFTDRTIATVRLETTRPDISQTLWYRTAQKSRLPLLWGLMLMAASAVGYVAAQTLYPNDADMLARDFEVVRNLDRYQEVGSSEFLQELNRNPELMQQIKDQTHVPARR